MMGNYNNDKEKMMKPANRKSYKEESKNKGGNVGEVAQWKSIEGNTKKKENKGR